MIGQARGKELCINKVSETLLADEKPLDIFLAILQGLLLISLFAAYSVLQGYEAGMKDVFGV